MGTALTPITLANPLHYTAVVITWSNGIMDEICPYITSLYYITVMWTLLLIIYLHFRVSNSVRISGKINGCIHLPLRESACLFPLAV